MLIFSSSAILRGTRPQKPTFPQILKPSPISPDILYQLHTSPYTYACQYLSVYARLWREDRGKRREERGDWWELKNRWGGTRYQASTKLPSIYHTR